MRDFKRWAVERDPSLAPDFGDTDEPDYRTLASRLAAALEEIHRLTRHDSNAYMLRLSTIANNALAEARAAGLLEETR